MGALVFVSLHPDNSQILLVFRPFSSFNTPTPLIMKKLVFLVFGLLPFFVSAQTALQGGRQFFDLATIGEIRITFNQSNWNSALDSLRIYGKGFMSAQVSIDGVKYPNSGVRYRGNASYRTGLKRNPFHIKLDYADPEQNHQGVRSIKISSALRDPSLVREVLFSEIARNYMPAPRANYVKIYVDNKYLGLFVNIESIGTDFLEKHYGSSNNSFFTVADGSGVPTTADCKQAIMGALEYENDLDCYKANFELKSAAGWEDIQELSRVLNNDPDRVNELLNIDETLWMHALNNVMVNLSSYTGKNSENYYLYKDNAGKFRPIIWDLNLSFGSYKNTGDGSDLSLKELQRLDPLLHAENPYKPLISQLLKDPFYKKIYIAHMRQIFEEHFKNGEFAKRSRALQALIVVPFSEDPHNAYNLGDFEKSLTETVGRRSKIPGIIELMNRRTRFLKSHPELTALPSAISNITVEARGQFEKERLNTFNISVQADRFPKRALLYYRFKPDQPYATVSMKEDVDAALGTGEKAFSANIQASNPDAELDFYILAENAGAVSFSPSNYQHNPRKVKLSDLNK